MSFLVDQASDVGKFVSIRNRARQFDFVHTSFMVSMYAAGLDIDHEFICSLNAYATRYLSQQPGRYRRHYNVTVGKHTPSDWSLVLDEMEAFIETLHRNWSQWNAIEAASYALWAVNHVHPFCEGNGRTARALSYFVLCRKLERWLPGSVTVIEMIRSENRDHYCEILQRMHDGRSRPDMMTDLAEMTAFIDALVINQIQLASEQAQSQEQAA